MWLGDQFDLAIAQRTGRFECGEPDIKLALINKYPVCRFGPVIMPQIAIKGTRGEARQRVVQFPMICRYGLNFSAIQRPGKSLKLSSHKAMRQKLCVQTDEIACSVIFAIIFIRGENLGQFKR